MGQAVLCPFHGGTKKEIEKDNDLAWASGADSNMKPRLGSECIRAVGLRTGYTQRFLESEPGDKEVTFDPPSHLATGHLGLPWKGGGVPTLQGDKVSLWSV